MGYDRYEEATAYLDIANIGSLYKSTCRFTSKLTESSLLLVVFRFILFNFLARLLLHPAYLTPTYKLTHPRLSIIWSPVTWSLSLLYLLSSSIRLQGHVRPTYRVGTSSLC